MRTETRGNSKKDNMLYVSDWCKRMGYTPENNYDPRYYYIEDIKLDQLDEDFMNFINARSSDKEYSLERYDTVLYTENFYLQQILQDDYGIVPEWFDCCERDITTIEDLLSEEYIW